MLHFFCLSWKATNGFLLNGARLCLNLAEHMLGGIKAILFLKQYSTQLSSSIILYRLLPQNETVFAKASVYFFFSGASELEVLIKCHNTLTYLHSN